MQASGPAINNADRRASQATGTCGCIGIKFPGAAKVSASPEFKSQLEEGVKALVEKAKQVQTNGRPL